MKRIVSIIARDKDGKLMVLADRELLACDDAGSGLDSLVRGSQAIDDHAFIVLGEDDSVLRHWTRPEEGLTPPGAAAAGPAQATAAKARKSHSKKRRAK